MALFADGAGIGQGMRVIVHALANHHTALHLVRTPHNVRFSMNGRTANVRVELMFDPNRKLIPTSERPGAQGEKIYRETV